MLVLGSGLALILTGKDIKGFTLVISSLVAIISLFISGKAKQKKAEEDKV